MPELRVKHSTLVVAAVILVFIGLLMIATTAYQELVEMPQDEDYHMGIPQARYEWRSRSPVITTIGGILCAVGVVMLVVLLFLVYLEDFL